MILLVDADYLAYRTAAGCQVKTRWSDDIITTHIDLEQAKNVFDDAIANIQSMAGYDPTDENHEGYVIVLCWSCPSRRYHRHDISADYKSNRTGSPPLGLSDLREWAQSEWISYTRDGLEADDILGILATRPSILRNAVLGSKLFDGQRIVVVGVDKDLNQIPGWHLNPLDNGLGLYHVSDDKAAHCLAMQTLTGDATDGYPGCPGMGPVRAQRWIAEHGTSTESLIMAFQKAGLTQQDAAVQYNLARILTGETYDFKNKQPILWTPSVTSGSETTAA